MPLYTILIAFTLCLRVATQAMRSHVDVKHTVMLTLNTPLCYPHKSTVCNLHWGVQFLRESRVDFKCT